MTTTRDFVGENNPALLLHVEGIMPDYVKNASLLRPEDVAGLDAKAFADRSSRRYPVHTKAACWLSAVYCAAEATGEDEIMGCIEKMASLHGILEDVQQAAQFVSGSQETGQEKNASTHMNKFALAIDFEGKNGLGVEHFYPVGTLPDLVSSAAAIEKDFQAGRIPPPMMRKIACSVMDAASSFQLEDYNVPAIIHRYGRTNAPDIDAALAMLYTRKQAGVEDIAPYEQVLATARGSIYGSGSLKKAAALADEVALAIYDLDRANGIESYNTAIPDPWTILLRGPSAEEIKKQAASFVSVRDVQVPVSDFLNLSPEKIDMLFNKDTAGTIKEARELLLDEPGALEKAATASAKIESLTDPAKLQLLAALLRTGW